jgi:hypothetical protein
MRGWGDVQRFPRYFQRGLFEGGIDRASMGLPRFMGVLWAGSVGLRAGIKGKALSAGVIELYDQSTH